MRLQLFLNFETQRVEQVDLHQSDGRVLSFRLRNVPVRFPSTDAAQQRDPLVRQLRRRLDLDQEDLDWGDTGQLPTLALLHEHSRVVTAVANALRERGILAPTTRWRSVTPRMTG